MKGYQTKIIAFLLTLIVHISFLFAQGVEENAEVRNYLNNMFSTLDRTKVPNGLLNYKLCTRLNEYLSSFTG